MALDVGIQIDLGAVDPLTVDMDPHEQDLVVGLGDGDFYFLIEVFDEVERLTGVKISQYEDARLCGEQLDVLDKLLLRRMHIAERKSDKWNEFIGEQIAPTKKNIYEKMIRKDLLKKLADIKSLVVKAKKNDRVLLFFGD